MVYVCPEMPDRGYCQGRAWRPRKTIITPDGEDTTPQSGKILDLGPEFKPWAGKIFEVLPPKIRKGKKQQKNSRKISIYL